MIDGELDSFYLHTRGKQAERVLHWRLVFSPHCEHQMVVNTKVLLHHGYTPEQVALRLEQREQVFNTNADHYLPDNLPVAELANETPAGLPLSEDETRRVRECYEKMPRRTRYVLTVRLGPGVPKQTLREAAEPLALHLTRIQQLQLYAQGALLQAAADGRRTTRPGLRAAIMESLCAMAAR